MKTKCVNSRDYATLLTSGKEYEVIDIQEGIFAGTYYVTVIGDNGGEVSGHYWRFDITKDQAHDYAKAHYEDAR